MNKDVIYIDVEDDITAIIGKVKDAKEKIIALVPPKRVGVLQSAVNLRLLARAAKQSNKHLVIITSNTALSALAAAAQVPVAKNLQSKPELAEIAALDIDNGEDVIDGAQLPIGELARTADQDGMGSVAFATPKDSLRVEAAEEIARAAPPSPGESPKIPKSKSGVKVPNFSKFRKRLILGGVGGTLLILFLVWALFFAAHATVMITARTTDSSANTKITIGTAVSTDASKNTLKAAMQQVKKDSSIDFVATGTKEVGDKATGSMKLTRTSVSSNTIEVPAGTSFSYESHTFVSTQSATLGGTSVGPGGLQQDSATVNVVAAQLGDDYNLSARSYQSNVSGFSAQGSDMSGGTKRQISVVSAGDIQKALDQLTQQSGDDIKKQLKGQFTSEFIVFDQSFKIDRGNPQSTPAVDQEIASGSKAKLTSSVTYSILGATKADVGNFLDTYFTGQLAAGKDQRIYDNGLSKVTFTNMNAVEGGVAANIVATAKIGPKINDATIKDIAKGKRYGEIQSSIESIQGVDDVDIKFSPFWVSAAPNDPEKITVEFKLNESK